MKRLGLLLPLLLAVPVIAQTATGDTRTVVEPTIPATCTTIAAKKYIVSTTAVNIDPWNPTCGSTGGTNGTLGCTGGTSWEPSSTSSSYTADETLDTTAVQNALTACPSGKAVELVQGTSGQAGFVMSPFNIPSGVTLLVDAGVTVFASRNLSDYGGTNCGIVASVSSCNHWITAPNTTGSGIMGYGMLDGRGWDAYIGQTTSGFYANRIQAYCNIHGGAIDGSPACTPNGAGNYSYGPNMFELVTANNFTMYKITLKDAGNFFVNWRTSSNGFTAWDTKIIAPFEVSNTDGWDPYDSSNGTWTHGFISTGDNATALKSSNVAVKNITVSYTQTGAGVGLAIGTDTRQGTSNVLFDHIVQNGNLLDTREAGLEIASSAALGGLVNQVTFSNVCMVNEYGSVRVYPNYSGTGSLLPTFTNLIFRNIHVLPSTAPYPTGNSGRFTFQGYDASHQTTLTLDNFVIDGVNQHVQGISPFTTDQYVTATLGPGAVTSSLVTDLNAGTGTTTSGTPGTSTPYPCTATTWQPLIGELALKTATANNLTSYTAPTSTGAYTLQATLIPATAINSKESFAVTQPLTFYDNGSPIGTGALSSNGTLATLALTGVPSGTHVYTAGYPGDTHYSPFTFGSVTATVPGVVAPVNVSTTFRGNTRLRGTITIH